MGYHATITLPRIRKDRIEAFRAALQAEADRAQDDNDHAIPLWLLQDLEVDEEGHLELTSGDYYVKVTWLDDATLAKLFAPYAQMGSPSPSRERTATTGATNSTARTTTRPWSRSGESSNPSHTMAIPGRGGEPPWNTTQI